MGAPGGDNDYHLYWSCQSVFLLVGVIAVIVFILLSLSSLLTLLLSPSGDLGIGLV